MSANLKPLLARVAGGHALTSGESEAAFDIIMAGEATPAQIAGLVTAMRVRGETVAELTGAVRAVRARMLRVAAPAGAIDVCGTGGDGAHTLNVSTAVAFVVAACGVPVAKHGNRALSSRSGAADVLVALGVDVDVPVERLGAVLDAAGCAFLFAPRHHAALRHAAGPRGELGFRTIFNLLGPMANPASVTRQMTGVFDPVWCLPMAEALAQLGTQACWIVHGQGLDELTVAGPSHVAAWDGAALRTFTIDPAALGLSHAPVTAIRGGDSAENAAALLDLLDGQAGPYADTVALNAGAALVVAGHAADTADGLDQARRALASGAARSVLNRLRAATRAEETR